MLLIPAIDLKDGQCVRLQQGDMNVSTTFGADPAAMAQRWLDAGARRLHLVDLNGAFAGKPVNEPAIKAILRVVGDRIPVQLGGGIRDLDTVERYLDDGLSYVIIGTAAVKSPGFLRDACTAFGGHIIVGLDAKEGKVATDGWSKLTGHEVIDLAKKFEDYGVEGVIYTDIGRDGMLTGINIEATVKLAQALTIPVFASGGLDAKEGKVATDGWSKLTGHEVIDLAKKFEDYGVEGVIYTDIGRDGMLTGINIEATVKLAQALTIPVFASGGLSDIADIERLCAIESEGVEGVICGRSIYTGALDFTAAQLRADELGLA